MSFSTPFRRIDRATSVGVYYRIRIKWPVFCIWNRNSKSGTGSAGTSETGSAGTSETGIAGTSETGTAGSFGTGTAGTSGQSWARDNIFALRQRQRDNVHRLSRQATTRQILASRSRDNVFRDNATATTIF